MTSIMIMLYLTPVAC